MSLTKKIINKIRYINFALKYSLPTWISRFKFYLNCKGILDTEPIKPKEDGILLISIVSHRDYLMYLVAAKSLYSYFKRGSFIVINDGSLTEKHEGLFKRHIKGIKIVKIGDISNPRCPKGGTWERLLLAADYSKDNFIIIFDADTITLQSLDDVDECISNNNCFIMSSGFEHVIAPMRQVWETEAPRLSKLDLDKCEVQCVIDAKLDTIKGFENLNYIKATSGFHGWGKGLLTRDRLETFSQELEKVFGRQWHRWGTEQIIACLLISNIDESISLPYRKYPIYDPGQDIDFKRSSIIHFMGKNRFNGGFYLKSAKSFIENSNKN